MSNAIQDAADAEVKDDITTEVEETNVDDNQIDPVETSKEEVSADSDKDESNQDEDDKPKKVRPKRNLQRKINKLTRQASEAETARLEAEKEAAYYKGLAEGKKEELQKPVSSDFDTYDEFLDARDEYNAALNKPDEIKPEPKPADDAPKNESQAITSMFDKALEEYGDDFIEMVVEDDSLAITPTMLEAMSESEVGHKVAMHLAEHPEEARRISSLSETAQIREVMSLEAKQSRAKTPGKKTTDAPDPITPVHSNDGGVTEPLTDESDINVWMAAREKQNSS